MKTDNVRSPLFPFEEAENCLYFRRNHDILLGPLSDLLFHMMYVGHYICGIRYHIERDRLPSALLLLTLSGAGELRYQGGSYPLRRGACMFIDTRNPHEFYPLAEGWEFKYLHFWGGGTGDYLAYLGQNAGPVQSLDEGEIRRAESILDGILDETEAEAIGDYPALSGEIYSLITLLMSHDRRRAEGQKPDSGSLILRAVEYIRRNYDRTIRTEDIARAVSLSRTNLFALFQKVYGIPPHEYLTEYRLSIAKDLLTNTPLSVTEIAAQTGFRDIYAFSRRFRDRCGMSPLEFRRRSGPRQEGKAGDGSAPLWSRFSGIR